jgi:hypothetical protein
VGSVDRRALLTATPHTMEKKLQQQNINNNKTKINKQHENKAL